MLWVIRDDSYNFDGGGPDTTVVRAQSREEAVQLWLQNDEYTSLKKENGSWFVKVFDTDWEPLKPESILSQKLVKYTAGDDHKVQVIPLDPEGESGVLVDREIPEGPKAEPKPEPERPELTVEGLAFQKPPPTLRSPTVRIVCTNTLSAALEGGKLRRSANIENRVATLNKELARAKRLHSG